MAVSRYISDEEINIDVTSYERLAAISFLFIISSFCTPFAPSRVSLYFSSNSSVCPGSKVAGNYSTGGTALPL